MANATAAQICVLPLSSPYSLLPRAHTYALAAVLLLPLPRGWLFRAALAAFTTRTAIFAVDATVLLHTAAQLVSSSSPTSNDGTPLPLDALVVLELTGLAALVAAWLLLVSRRGTESSARGLVRAWTAVVAAGAAMALAAVAHLGSAAVSSAEESDATCDGGVWVDGAAVFGDAETVRVLGTVGAKIASFAGRVGVPAAVMAALAVVALTVPREAAEAIAVGTKSGPTPGLFDVERNAFRREYGLDEIAHTGGSPWKGLEALWKLCGYVLLLALPTVAVFMAVEAELYIAGAGPGGLPVVERMSSPGQWGVWVATGAVVLATVINAVMQKMGLKSGSSKVNALPGSMSSDGVVRF